MLHISTLSYVAYIAYIACTANKHGYVVDTNNPEPTVVRP
jgi:hypothetical protein